MREAHVDGAGSIQALDVLGGKLPVQHFQLILQLLLPNAHPGWGSFAGRDAGEPS